MFDEHVSTAITLWTDFYTFFCFTAASAVELIVWVIGWLPACPSACHQTFSNQYFYSFCQIPTELGTLIYVPVQKKTGTDFQNFDLKFLANLWIFFSNCYSSYSFVCDSYETLYTWTMCQCAKNEEQIFKILLLKLRILKIVHFDLVSTAAAA